MKFSLYEMSFREILFYLFFNGLINSWLNVNITRAQSIRLLRNCNIAQKSTVKENKIL